MLLRCRQSLGIWWFHQGTACLSYIMIQRFILAIYWGLFQEPHCNKQSFCQFPNPLVSAPPLPLVVTEPFPVVCEEGEAVIGKYNKCHPPERVWFCWNDAEMCVCVCVCVCVCASVNASKGLSKNQYFSLFYPSHYKSIELRVLQS